MINDRVHQILEKIQHYINNINNINNLPKKLPKLVAVSKRFSIDAILQAHAAGIENFAENYLQEAMAKIDECRQNYPEIEKAIIWHYIGQAQSNKCKYLVKYFTWVQTLDDIAFANKLNHEMKKSQQIKKINRMNVCIQVNIDGSLTKNGAKYEDVLALAQHIQQHCPYLRLRGIMAMPDMVDEVALKMHYQKSHDLFKELQNIYGEDIDTHSIGMSQDMQIAIEAGSTMLRIGQAIFGERS